MAGLDMVSSGILWPGHWQSLAAVSNGRMERGDMRHLLRNKNFVAAHKNIVHPHVLSVVF
ncbi:hypothetical protein [Neorhizobium sp. NCHU2750]|uniref:hypothetical protein n=1 Tax=Neorhizobium sp. NCHU2750 TaxID=1825976 RepID=UPI0013C49C63